MKTNQNLVIETERLLLRPFTIEDSIFIIELLNSPGWLKFIGDRHVKTKEQAENYLINGPLKSYSENGFGLSLVQLKNTKTSIGMCGLLKRDYLENPDIGFAFLPEYTGKGYAYEIAKATIIHANDILKLSRIMAITMPSNKASIGLLEKIGLIYLKTISSPTSTEELMLFSN